MKSIVYTVTKGGIFIRPVDDLMEFFNEPPHNVGLHFFSTGNADVLEELRIASGLWMDHYSDKVLSNDHD